VLVLLTDVFGLTLSNNRVLADKMAEQGYTVYVPDILLGEDIPTSLLPPGPKTLWSKIKTTGALVSILPWLFRHRSAVILPLVKRFITDIKVMHPGYRVGATGYCFGGLYSVYLGESQQYIDVGFACHPSLVSETMLNAISIPFGFACAEVDGYFPPSVAEKAKEYLIQKKIPVDLVVYPGTEHGFGARPDLGNEAIRNAFYASIQQTVDFFNKYL